MFAFHGFNPLLHCSLPRENAENGVILPKVLKRTHFVPVKTADVCLKEGSPVDKREWLWASVWISKWEIKFSIQLKSGKPIATH